MGPHLVTNAVLVKGFPTIILELLEKHRKGDGVAQRWGTTSITRPYPVSLHSVSVLLEVSQMYWTAPRDADTARDMARNTGASPFYPLSILPNRLPSAESHWGSSSKGVWDMSFQTRSFRDKGNYLKVDMELSTNRHNLTQVISSRNRRTYTQGNKASSSKRGQNLRIIVIVGEMTGNGIHKNNLLIFCLGRRWK